MEQQKKALVGNTRCVNKSGVVSYKESNYGILSILSGAYKNDVHSMRRLFWQL